MKLFTLSTAVLLNALALVTPLTEAAPVDSMEARALPHLPTAAIAKEYLASLTIKPKANRETYNPELFPMWSRIEGECYTRDIVLIRDGTDLVIDKKHCDIKSGSWYSALDGDTETNLNRVRIASIVPNLEAWMSGASDWTTDQREAFANDVTRPQLIAATDRVYQDKGDWDPVRWMPRVATYQCTYIRAWITVKHYYSLSVDQAEHNLLSKYINGCVEDDA